MEGPGADEVLLARLASGDEGAMGELYDRYATRLYTLALHICREGGAAEEVVQDVFLTAWRQAARFDPRRGSVAAWLFALARHRAIDWLRRRSRQPAAAMEDGVLAAVLGNGAGSLPAADVAGQAEEELLAREVRRVLEELPEMYRVPLFLAYYRGLTQREIAQLLGLPLGTVKTRLRTALELLRQALASQTDRHRGVAP